MATKHCSPKAFVILVTFVAELRELCGEIGSIDGDRRAHHRVRRPAHHAVALKYDF